MQGAGGPTILYFSQQCRECCRFLKLLQQHTPHLMQQLQFVDIDYNQFPQFIEYVPAVFFVNQRQLFQANQAFQWLKHVAIQTLQAQQQQQHQQPNNNQFANVHGSGGGGQMSPQRQAIEDGFNAIQPTAKNFSYVSHKRANTEGVIDEKISTSFDNQGKVHVPQTPMDGSPQSGQEQFVLPPPGAQQQGAPPGGWGQQQGAMGAAGPMAQQQQQQMPALPAALQPIETKLDGAAAMNEMNNKLNDLMARRDADVPRQQRM